MIVLSIPQSIPVGPIVLDTASTLVEYPSLEHRIKKTEKKGVLSSLFGWGSNAKK
jgi:signal recognition particle subunit SRP68